ncbi:MAG: type II toxin-antitoxin system HicA family toxin [Planctomycetes bacterium]|nr:type II toxin-antitoxin system HicA family toxin [Planctomycetota bacterium]
MSKLKPLKPEEVIQKLRKLGYKGPVPGGRHVRMYHPVTLKVIPIPMHKGKDIGVGLIREIINELEISRKEWIEL